MSSSTQLLLVECADQPGLVHGITGVLLRHKVNVVGNHEFVERELGRFFMRTEFDGTVDVARIEAEVRAVLPAAAIVRCAPVRARARMAVSRENTNPT